MPGPAAASATRTHRPGSDHDAGGGFDRNPRSCLAAPTGTRDHPPELPYQTNKASLIERIAENGERQELEGISDIRDESDPRRHAGSLIELRRDAPYPSGCSTTCQLTPLPRSNSAPHCWRVNKRANLLTCGAAAGVPAFRVETHRTAHPLPATQGRGTRPHPAGSVCGH